MLTYVLDKSKKRPLYEQLYVALRGDIISGVIEGGARLPSKREFADHLGVSKVTVEAAYAQLIAEGYVRSEEKRGYYAEKDIGARGGLRHDNNEKTVSEERGLRADLSSNTVPPDRFPFSVWAKLMRNVCLDYRSELLRSLPYNGAYCLRQAIADYLFEQRGMSVLPGRIFIGSGSEYLYGVISGILGKGRTYGIEDPSYPRIASSYRQSGVRTVPVEVDSGGIRIDRVREKGIDVLHISPSHNFPLGVVTGPRRRRDIINWLNTGGDRYVIEDDFDSELRFSGTPLPPLQSYDTGGRVIYMNTFSKTIAPSVRISYIILPEKLAERARELYGSNGCTVSSFEQYTLAEFINGGWFERHISRNKKYYRTLRDEIFAVYSSGEISRRARIEEAQAGLHFLLCLDTGRSDAALKKDLLEKGIKASFLSDYLHSGGGGEHKLLVNYSGLTPGDFEFVTNELIKLL